ncbi:MAG: hypothetical protein SVV03_02705, partial [Candidatus Nanohaloarchaea archaeon]|nr:hypothetical protein [Candidatus Nanohaloarchaea archaeon]
MTTLSMEEEYKWRKKWRIEPSIDVEHEPEKTAIGWDVKITPEGKPKIIEYHEHDFGTKGFS